LNGLMAIPNLLSLLLLSPIVVKLTQVHFAKNNDVSLARGKNI
jgi:AGCS family alanine or glycine:cation symporter